MEKKRFSSEEVKRWGEGKEETLLGHVGLGESHGLRQFLGNVSVCEIL